jgi:alcohol dehydrogenase class IV
MLWHQGQKRIFVHDRLVPRLAILDPSLLAGAPPSVTAASGLDAISHAIESLLSTFRTPLTEARAESALRRLAGALPNAYAGGDPAASAQTLLGAYEAGLGLNASVVVGHSIAYAIAARSGLPHGVTCAMALPYCLAYCRSASEDAIAEIGASVGIDRDASAVFDWTNGLNASLGIPASLAEVGIGRDEIPAMAREVAEQYPRVNNPLPIGVESLESLLDEFHAGRVTAAWNACPNPRQYA